MQYRSEIIGVGGIIARCVAKSVSKSTGVEITTLELEYPRFIHSELMTHRLFSRNAASSRAIPIAKTIEQVRTNPAMPVHWGKNQPGMQAKEELTGKELELAKAEWLRAATQAADRAEWLEEYGAHKQVANRILEPFVFMKTVVTSTEWNNWDSLRLHEDADPTIYEVARVAKLARDVKAIELSKDQWHVPYYCDGFWKDSGYVGNDMVPIFNKRDSNSTLENALAISASCCAQVSFRSLDPSLEKADRVFDRLIHSKPVHASPTEHQATPIEDEIHSCYDDWPLGVTHYDRKHNFWSGNFKEWIQHRQLISENVVEG